MTEMMLEEKDILRSYPHAVQILMYPVPPFLKEASTQLLDQTDI